jgi:hypothetical protein
MVGVLGEKRMTGEGPGPGTTGAAVGAMTAGTTEGAGTAEAEEVPAEAAFATSAIAVRARVRNHS